MTLKISCLQPLWFTEARHKRTSNKLWKSFIPSNLNVSVSCTLLLSRGGIHQTVYKISSVSLMVTSSTRNAPCVQAVLKAMNEVTVATGVHKHRERSQWRELPDDLPTRGLVNGLMNLAPADSRAGGDVAHKHIETEVANSFSSVLCKSWSATSICSNISGPTSTTSYSCK